MGCNTCDYCQDGKCVKIPPVYIGYDCNSSVCQSCDNTPSFPEGEFACQVIFDYYKSLESVSCCECPKKDSCEERILNCGGRLTDICFLNTFEEKVIVKEDTVLSDGVEAVEKTEEVVQVPKVLNECDRFCSVDKCKPCSYILTRFCAGFPQPDICQNCERPLNCGSCGYAYKRLTIPEMCDSGEGKVVINEMAIKSGNLGVRDSGKVQIAEAPIDEAPIDEAPVDDISVEGYSCEDYTEKVSDNVIDLGVVDKGINLDISQVTPMKIPKVRDV